MPPGRNVGFGDPVPADDLVGFKSQSKSQGARHLKGFDLLFNIRDVVDSMELF
jgi:hypothetical protein